MKENLILDRTFQFSLDIIELYKALVQEKEYVISRQVLRSGTSIGANVEEATAAVSKKDFAYKMSISSKEARETRYWLRLLKFGKLTAYALDPLIRDAEELIRILTSIVKTTQKKLSDGKI